MVFGTFDFLHKGHLDFFKQARSLSQKPFLIVSIARDQNVKKIKRKSPLYNEQERLASVAGSKLVDKAVLGGLRNYLSHIVKERPQIIALGYDQSSYTKGLKHELMVRGLHVKIVRLKAHRPHLYKSSILKAKKSL